MCLSAGCKPEDDIRTYTAPKPTAEPTTPHGPDKERTLGVILPLDDKYSVFVKLRGPVDVVGLLEADFDAFAGSLKGGGADNPPAWTPPSAERWREGPPKQFRTVTFQTGPADKPVEMYLSTPIGGAVLDNVNRWRGEVGLRDVRATELADSVKEIQVDGRKAYRVDVKGPGGQGGMMGMPAAGGK
jgi:hypothetical protein